MSNPPKMASRRKNHPTVSIAIPGSVVSNAQTRELQTQLAGQIARAAAVFRVDEVVVYDDGLGSTLKTMSNYRRGNQRRRDGEGGDDEGKNTIAKRKEDPRQGVDTEKPAHLQASTDPHTFLARILQYCECPQYLRRKLFPMHPDLQFCGLLPPLDAPHHLRRGDVATYREGIVVDNEDANDSTSLVDCGVPNRLVKIDRKVPPGVRCTVRLEPKAYETGKKGHMKGEVVSPTCPRDEEGVYWGYTTRMASTIDAIFAECPYGSYDMKVGTSERGDVSIDDPKFCLRKRRENDGKPARRPPSAESEGFDHLLIVFGGVAGIEESVDAHESMHLSGRDSRKLFDVWVNVCPYQGSRTIRSEEAVFITLARLSPYIARNATQSGSASSIKPSKTEDAIFSDEVSEESSEEDDS